MNVLERRNGDRVIEEKFIEQTLRDTAADILRDSRREMKGFNSQKWKRRGMNINKNTLTYDHLAVHRFVDMKTRKAKTYTSATRKMKAGRERKKKSYPIHNKVIFSHKRFLIKRLSFGFTESVKDQFRKLLSDVV